MTKADILRGHVDFNRRLREAVLADWEVVDDPSCRVRRMDVVRTVAHRMAVRVNFPWFVPKVNRAVLAHGGVPIRPVNVATWRGLRRRVSVE